MTRKEAEIVVDNIECASQVPWSSPQHRETAIENVLAGVNRVMPAEKLAQAFHEAYERLAPNFGYRTREASAKPWADVPQKNKDLMIAVCYEINALLVYDELKCPICRAQAYPTPTGWQCAAYSDHKSKGD